MKSVIRRSVAGALVFAAVLAWAAPAWSHEEITPATVPTGRPTFLTLSAANEQGSDLTRVTLRPPAGVSFGTATQQPAGWTADRSPSVITWSGGVVPNSSFGQWGFEIDAVGQPGPLRFTVELAYADGSSHDSQVEIVAEGAAVTAAPTTVAPPPEATTVPGAVAPAEEADDGDGLAITALVVSIVAALLAIVAIALATRARPAGAAPPASTTKEEQDW